MPAISQSYRLHIALQKKSRGLATPAPLEILDSEWRARASRVLDGIVEMLYYPEGPPSSSTPPVNVYSCLLPYSKSEFAKS